MAGEVLLDMMNSRGGSPGEYSDIVFGKVVSVSPLNVQYSNNLILVPGLLKIARSVTKYKVKLTYKDKDNGSDRERTEEVEIDNSLKPGDGVVMVRRDGGQEFVIIDKVVDA